jgi:Dynamin family
MDSQSALLETLKTAIGLLELPPEHSLRQDLAAISICRSTFRIAVFAPFNYGKSTLLNAILGDRALPIDLIPTTGAAIAIRHGHELRTHIQLLDGTQIHESGTEILQRFAILDENRRMRQDVASVEVFCPHSWLQTGVELLDLPGTDDQEAQDQLVKTQLLTADLVIQVLDGRKLMTLQERENLRDWLGDRGITTVLFVVNFLNLLEPDDQKQVMHRLRFVAESFRSQLPPGISNLYRVDALPALRARLKGDLALAQASGLPILESALQTITQTQPTEAKLPRIKAIALPIQQALQAKINSIAAETDSAAETRHQRLEIKRKAQTLIRQGFTTSAAHLRNWLAFSNLQNEYEAIATTALQHFEFSSWETTLKADWQTQTRSLAEWIYKACDFLEVPRPADLWISFPSEPQVTLPNVPPSAPKSTDLTPTAIATGLGWVLGGPVGATVLGGASYLFNRNTSEPARGDRLEELHQANLTAIRDYLTRFSTTALTALSQYETEAAKVLHLDITDASAHTPANHHHLTLLKTTLEQINQQLTDDN